MAQVFIGIGSNLGDRASHIDRASTQMGRLRHTQLVGVSGVYETDPVGPVKQGPFLNAVAQLETHLGPYDLFHALERIERHAGREPRERRVKWGPRTLDLDLLLYGDQVVNSAGLTVPHARLHERWFVLRPLADLAPQRVHPVLGKTVAQLLAGCEQPSQRGVLERV